MKIVFLCKRYYTNKDLLEDRFGRLFHLPLELARLGHGVSVLALDYRGSAPREEFIDGVEFHTIPSTLTRFPMALPRLRRLVKKFGPDVIIASGDSHIGFIGSRLASKVGARFVFDVYDYYPVFPGNRIPGMRAMFNSALRRADLVLCASIPLLNKLSPTCAKAVLIENGVDRQVFRPLDKSRAREAMGLSHDIPVVGYFGSVTPNQGPLLFEAVRQLRAAFPGIVVLLAGRVNGCDISQPFIIYKGLLPQRDLPQLIAACDIVTVPYARNPQIDMSGACKIAEYLACERPIVATRVAGHHEILSEVPQSIFEPNASDLAMAIRQQLGEQITMRFPNELDWHSVGRKLMRKLPALVDS